MKTASEKNIGKYQEQSLALQVVYKQGTRTDVSKIPAVLPLKW